ncbi:MAG: ASCH domain-containing protein [Microbacteriaceae bacterium]|nr:ASCH domain-containing protein [Microbacteriaceae bacterium]MCL2794162.1 ASCH domain-containing protein [Microbacteriaceae bacterium]
MTEAAFARFWAAARAAEPRLSPQPAPAWAFGADPGQADELLGLVLAGIKTATSSLLREYAAAGEKLPQAGDLSILLDGAGSPRAVIETTDVTVVRFGEVDAEHARAEGEDDRTLESWRREHERFWRRKSRNESGFAPDLPVVCERFDLVYAAPTPLSE